MISGYILSISKNLLSNMQQLILNKNILMNFWIAGWLRNRQIFGSAGTLNIKNNLWLKRVLVAALIMLT